MWLFYVCPLFLCLSLCLLYIGVHVDVCDTPPTVCMICVHGLCVICVHEFVYVSTIVCLICVDDLCTSYVHDLGVLRVSMICA